MLHDALIIGAGPAGLSAALALGRVCRTALVLSSSIYRNAGVTAMHTVLTRDGTHPEEFRRIALEQLEKYPSVQIQHGNIVSVEQSEVAPAYSGFKAIDAEGNEYLGRKLVLATGTEDVLPSEEEMPGYRQNWPEHIYQCLFCDGFEQRHHPIGVLTFPNASYNHLVLMALKFNPEVTIYSSGPMSQEPVVQEALKIALASGAKLDERKVKRLINNGPGPEKGISVKFEEGGSVKLGMLLHRPPTRNRSQHLIDQLGLKTREGGGEVVVDPVFGRTSVKGCFSAGDTAEMVKQVAIGMGSGVRAGAVVSMQLCNEEGAANVAAMADESGTIDISSS